MSSTAPRWRRYWGLASVIALVFAVAAAAGVAKSAGAARRDSFAGAVKGTGGSYSGDHGTVRALLLVGDGRGGSDGASRGLVVRIRDRDCGESAHCFELTGKLTGKLTAEPSIPDAGQSFKVRVSGIVAPLGHVSVAGTVHGTGFIARGREQLRLTLTGSAGSVRIRARSKIVRGFTSP